MRSLSTSSAAVAAPVPGWKWASPRGERGENHTPQAIIKHTVNHPDAMHYTNDVFDGVLDTECGGKAVGWFHMSPDYHHIQAPSMGIKAICAIDPLGRLETFTFILNLFSPTTPLEYLYLRQNSYIRSTIGR